MRHLAFTAFIFVLSCAERPTRPSSSPETPAQATHDEGDLADPCDMCVLQGGDEAGRDEDGCPAPDFRLTDACSLPPEAQTKIVSAAKEIRANPHMTIVRLVSAKDACAGAVRKALVQAGVPGERLETATAGTGTGVSFEVGQWDGRRCAH